MEYPTFSIPLRPGLLTESATLFLLDSGVDFVQYLGMMILKSCKIWVVPVVWLLLWPASALAHPFHGSGFVPGIIHPFHGLDHLLAALAVSFLAIRYRLPLGFPALFLMGLGGGMLLGFAGFALPAIEVGILLSVCVFGMMLAVTGTAKRRLAGAVIVFFGLFHGQAHAFEMASDRAVLAYAFGVLAGTTLLHAVGVGAGVGLDRVRSWPVLRLAGAAIFIAGVLTPLLAG